MAAGGLRRRSALSSVRVPTPGVPADAYEVIVEAGSLERLGALCRERVGAHRYAVLTDSRVGELYGEAVQASLADAGCRADLHAFPAGEWNKSRAEWARLSDRVLASGMGRDGAVIALGGGVAGDLAGFVAATYMRGVPVIHVPTTLLAMLDSSVGGKTGVDTEAGKNLIGAFHHPRFSLVDPELLSSLPRMHRRAGLAEAVKMAAVRDAGLFAWMEERVASLAGTDGAAIEELILRVVRHKAEVVGADPTERGERAILNFGHTVAHALELLAGYALLHGEAVAAGMRVEAGLGERLGRTEPGTAGRIEALLDGCGLEGRPERERSGRRLWEAASADKKARGGSVRFVLLAEVGRVARPGEGGWTWPLPEGEETVLLEAAIAGRGA